MVLTGGGSRRLGRDKATAHVGGRTLLDRIVSAVPPGVTVVVVGPVVPGLAGRVQFAREDPPGAGPLAGIGAGLRLVGTPMVGVLAADMPFGWPALAASLARLDAEVAVDAGSVDAVVPVDAGGHAQPLCAAYRTDALRAGLAAVGELAGRPVRAALAALRVVQWSPPPESVLDIDTDADLVRARQRAAKESRPMQDWVDAVRDALGLDVTVDIDAVLDVARDAAHAVARPAAPVTTYLLGVAVAQGADPAHAAATITALASSWTPSSP